MKISVISPVKNEVDFIGYSAMSVLPYVHEILYGVAPSDDGTMELLQYLSEKYDEEHKIQVFKGGTSEQPNWDFDPLDMKAYDASYNYLIEQATGDAVWFLHPDMIVTNPEAILKVPDGPTAWWTNVRSYAKDVKTEILSGRAKRWKNIHVNQFGLHYYGEYGSANEDFYHKDITGKAYRHHGQDFAEYPFEVADSGINVNHYCELKSYERRLEKMKRCLKTQHPSFDDKKIEELAMRHPRVTLEAKGETFGHFEFGPSSAPVPTVFTTYGSEFGAFKKGSANVR